MCEFNTGYHLYVLLSLARVLGLHLVSSDYFLQAILERSSKMKWSTSSWFSVLCLPNGLRGFYLVWNSVSREVLSTCEFHSVAVEGSWRPPGSPTEHFLGVPSVISENVPLSTWLGCGSVVIVWGWCPSPIHPFLGSMMCFCFSSQGFALFLSSASKTVISS